MSGLEKLNGSLCICRTPVFRQSVQNAATVALVTKGSDLPLPIIAGRASRIQLANDGSEAHCEPTRLLSFQRYAVGFHLANRVSILLNDTIFYRHSLLPGSKVAKLEFDSATEAL